MNTSKLLLTIFLLSKSLFLFSQNVNKAIELYKSNKYDEAYSIFSSVGKSSSQFAESSYYLALISLQKQDLSKAEEYLKRAIAANGDVAKYHVSMVMVYGQMISSANMIRQATLASRLKSHMETAVKLNPKDMNTSFMLIGFYTRAPKFMGGDIEKAKVLANDMVKTNRAEGSRALGFIAQTEEKYTEAETYYKRALTISPDSVKHHYSLVSLYQAQSKFDSAMEVYEKAIERFPDNKNLLYNAGRMASSASDKFSSKGVIYLKEYIAKAPNISKRNLTEANYHLGLLELKMNNKIEARKHFNAALKIDPEHEKSKQAIKDMT
jgi:tetratricopeptide (TPR) repeat protein